MARATHTEIEALQKLVGILEEAQTALRKTGQESADVEDWIGKLQLSIEGAVGVIPNINEITDAFTRLEAGIGGVVRMGASLGNMPLGDAARGVNLSRAETAPLETDIINDFGKEIKALDSTKLREVAVELNKINDADFSVKEIRNFGKEMENLKDVRVFDKDKVELVADLRDALAQLKDVAEIEVKVTGLSQSEEQIKDLESTIITLSETDLSKVSKEFKELRGGFGDFSTEDIKAFVENIQELSQTDPENVTRVIEELVKSLESLRKSGEIAGSVKELGDALSKLSDENLTKISEEFKALKWSGADFSIEDIKALAESLSRFEVSSGTGENIKQLEVAFKTITNTSQLSTKEIKELGQQLSELEDIDLERLVVAVNSIANLGFDTDSVKAYADVIKDIQSRGILGESGLREIDALDEALTHIGREQALPFAELTDVLNTSGISAAEFTKELDHLSQQLNRASRADIDEFALELQFLKENLGGLGLETDKIETIIEHFEKLGTIESPAKFFEELSQLGLPDEEVSKFAESFLTLRANSGEIDLARQKLEAFGLPDDSIEKLIQRLARIPEIFTRIRTPISGTSADFENLSIKFTNSADEADGFTVKLNRADRSLADIGETAKRAIPEVTQFAKALKAGGLDLDARRDIVTKAFGPKEKEGLGATSFTRLNWRELEEGGKSFTTTLHLGERGAFNLKVELNELGEVMKTLGGIAEKSPLRQFAEGLKAAGTTKETRRTIIDETSGPGIEGFSTPRITELDDGVTRLNANLKLGGGILKAYTVYWDKFGQVITELPVKDTTISLKDFTDQLAGRVGAVDSVTKMVDKYGFELSDLKKMSTEASTGLTRLDFAMKSQGGATENLTLHVTEFGKVLTDTQRRFRTFAGGIIRNVGHSFQWAVAITAVYGPLRKLQDLVEISIDNESKLADIGVVLGKNTSELQDIFADAAQAAEATGESLNGVIEGYALAYRATGSIGNEAERAAVSQQLLIDSLVLSKLSAIDQAEAMDTLVAGLLQTGRGLDEGAVLLNKWVAVSKAANVTVDTLASSFAIMATAGEGVGLSFDEMNAIIAIVAAKTELSATQAGNAVRAFVSGFQTQNAREELAKFGIAVEDLNGDARNFMTVMYDIKSLMDAGLIDEAELNRIGTALGGRGARRGAQFTTFLKSLNEVQGLVTVSAEAQGDAYEGLGVKMDTVQTAVTNLATSFQVLANAVGTDGGVLDLLKGLLGILNDITKSATSFVAIMGKAAPFLAVAGGLYTYGKYGSQRLGAMPGQLGGFTERLVGRTQYGQRPQGTGQMAFPGFGVQAEASGKTMAQVWGTRAQQYAPLLGTLAAQAMLAKFNVAEKDWDGLGAQIGGGVFGYLVGGPIGSIIGSTIAEAVINGLQAAGKSGELADAFKGILRDAEEPDEPEDTGLTREERLRKQEEKLSRELRQAAGGEWLTGANIFAKSADNFLNGLLGLPKKYKDELTGAQVAGGILSGAIEAFDEGGAEEVKGLPGLAGLGIDRFTSDEEIEQKIESYRELLAVMKDVTSQLDSIGKGEEPEGTSLDTELTANMEKYGDLLKDEITKAQAEFNAELISGELTIKQYRESMERMGTEGEAIMRIFSVLNDIFGDTEEVLLLTLDVISKTTAEEINIITNLTSGIGDLQQIIADAEAEGDRDLVNISTEKLDTAYLELESVFTQMRNAQREPLIQLDELIELDTRSIEDHNRVVLEAMRLLEEDMQESIRLGLIPSNTTIEEIVSTHEKIGVMIAGKYAETMQIPMTYYEEAMKNLAVPGRIEPPVEADRGISIKEIDQSQASFMAAYERQYQLLKDSFGDLYQGDFSTVGIIFSDGVDVLHLDNLAMQLAMNDLIDVNQKQLEGVYNLPTDSSFYVPFQGYKLGFGDEGGAAGGLTGAADELKEAAREIDKAALALASPTDRAQLRPYAPLPEDKRAFESPIALIGGEKYEEEYNLIGKQLARIAGEKYLEEYGPTPAREEQPLIGGEKYLEEYFGKPEIEKDPTLRAEESIREFQRELMKELEIPSLGIEDEQLGDAPTRNIWDLIWEGIKSWFTTPSADIPGVGIGAGIGPDISFNKLDSASTKLDNFAGIMQSQFQYTALGPQIGGTSDIATEFAGMLDLLSQKISNLSGFTTNLKISSISTTNLIVDGRTLAQVIKPYLYSDMIRYEDSASSVTKNIVV